jgi:hypothetical protein
MRRFNTTGPCFPAHHYMIEPLGRLPEAVPLIEQAAYFVVHAPRQTGKTTTLIALARALTAQGRYAALYFTCEAGEALGEDVGRVEQIVWQSILNHAITDLPAELQPAVELEPAPVGQWLTQQLTAWAQTCPRPLVLFFDEIDALRGESLRSVLRQLRAGFPRRLEGHFPHAIILCGLRDVRDYRAAAGGDPNRLGTSSPFNIKLTSLRLGDFTEAEVNELLDQHTADTGQVFTPEARTRLFQCTQGQPWLTNALAREAIEKAPDETITADHIDRARERLIIARATHLDSLLARLEETRVRQVLTPIIAGETLMLSSLNDDLLYLRDLGLIARDNPVRIANPIYREIIVRVLGTATEANITTPRQRFVAPDGRLDLDILLQEFMDFWIQHGEVLVEGHSYHEVAPQLVLMGYLHRVVNGGGFVDREYGIGRGRIDLLIRWPWTDPQTGRTWQRLAFELKLWRDRKPDPLAQGLKQLDEYLDGLGLDTGVLAIFDRRAEAAPIETRTGLSQATSPRGRAITVLRA